MSNKQKNLKQPIDTEFVNLTFEETNTMILKYTNMLKDLKTKRNFVYQERELISQYYQISIDEQKGIESNIEKIANEIEELDTEHKTTIAAFNNKYQHLEYEHDTFINNTLVDNMNFAASEENDIKLKRDDIYALDKLSLQKKLNEDKIKYSEEINDVKSKNEEKLKTFEEKCRKVLIEVKENYDKKIKELESDLELRLKIEIHELEERKNLHRSKLAIAFDERMAAWKKDNIKQIKENIDLIKTSTNSYDMIINENNKLKKEEQELIKQIEEKSKELEKAKQEHNAITNRLAKYYNQEINMSNMSNKIKDLNNKIKENTEKTKTAADEKIKLTNEISQITNKFSDAIDKFKERAEFKNNLIDNHINELFDRYTSKENEIEEYLKNVDTVINEDQSEAKTIENKNNLFSRENVKNFLDDIRNVLITKSQIIKNLKYSINKATKVSLLLII